jgi:hypothetical protein
MKTDTPPGSTAPAIEVAVFGAGIAGLTAAHELVERGFRVIVYESEAATIFETGCATGGMARTQWAWTTHRAGPGLVKGMEPSRSVDRTVHTALAHRLCFEPDKFVLTRQAKTRIKEIADALGANQDYEQARLIAVGYGYPDERAPGGVAAGQRRAEVVAHALKAHIGPKPPIKRADGGVGCPDTLDVDRADRCYVEVALDVNYLPGEHGFRFFPAFYRNMRDTMKRIPVPQDGDPYVETPVSVFDSLISLTEQGVSLEPPAPGCPPKVTSYVLPRRPVTSLEELFQLLRDSLSASGFTAADLDRFGVKLFKYMTSCAARRQTYEDISWWDFVEGDRYSPEFQRYLDGTPQALVAMKARECDARTFGNITVQILVDQLVRSEHTDAILSGPTSLALFRPWRRYLESQGVLFRQGTVVGFRFEDGGKAAWPVVAMDGGTVRKVIVRDYYVLALSIEGMRDLVDADPKLTGPDFDAVRALELGDAKDAKPQGLLQHLSGIQYFFDGDLRFLAGHVVYPDARWGLSSISQPQFWIRKHGYWSGYRTILSVGIGDWNARDPFSGKTGWEVSADEIARTVWFQIRGTIAPYDPATRPDDGRLGRRRMASIPTPTVYHLDRNLIFGPSNKPADQRHPVGNRSRMMVNTPGTFTARPGTPGCYALHYDGIVLAGTYMQTGTRLTTMESANESARHAVNAIIRDCVLHNRPGFAGGEFCDVADPERNEIADLAFLIEVDEELMKDGLPHAVDILRPGCVPLAWLRGPQSVAQMLRVARGGAR